MKGSAHIVLGQTMTITISASYRNDIRRWQPNQKEHRVARWKVENRILRRGYFSRKIVCSFDETAFQCRSNDKGPSNLVRGVLLLPNCLRISHFVAEHPNGKKTGQLKIPEVARLYPLTLVGFICGLFSVEGSVKVRRYPRLAMEMLERKLLHAVGDELRRLGFNPHSYHLPQGWKNDVRIVSLRSQGMWKVFERSWLGRKRRKKLNRFLTPSPEAKLARKQPGGGSVRRM